eukprot:123112_1
MELNLDFDNESMTMEQRLGVWREEYIKLFNKSQTELAEWHRTEDKRMKIIKQYQIENDRMSQTNKLSVQLVESLKKQIEKYQNNDNFDLNDHSNDDEIDTWKARYLTEKRTSQYLRAECEDLQNEIEELKENTANAATDIDQAQDNTNNDLEEMLKVVNEAWADEVATLIERYQSNPSHDFKNKIRMSFDKKKQQLFDDEDYEGLYHQVVQSKLELIQQTSGEIQRLRQIIGSQNHTLYRNIFDRIVRYHNLEGGDEDTLFQLMVDADLNT